MPVPHEADVVPIDPRERALQRLRKVRDFKRHLLAYVLFNGMIIAIWAMTGPPNDMWFPWFLFPLVPWGIGLVFHALDVYGSDITEADIEREMRREQGDEYQKAS